MGAVVAQHVAVVLLEGMQGERKSIVVLGAVAGCCAKLF